MIIATCCCWILVIAKNHEFYIFLDSHSAHVFCSVWLQQYLLGRLLFYLLCDNVLNRKLVSIFLRHIYFFFVEFMTLCVRACVCVRAMKKNTKTWTHKPSRFMFTHLHVMATVCDWLNAHLNVYFIEWNNSKLMAFNSWQPFRDWLQLHTHTVIHEDLFQIKLI